MNVEKKEGPIYITAEVVNVYNCCCEPAKCEPECPPTPPSPPPATPQPPSPTPETSEM